MKSDITKFTEMLFLINRLINHILNPLIRLSNHLSLLGVKIKLDVNVHTKILTNFLSYTNLLRQLIIHNNLTIF